MANQSRSVSEVVSAGEAIYSRDLRSRLEPDHVGEFVVVDVDTGDYELDTDEVAAMQRSIAKHPESQRYLKRVGYRTAHSLGGGLKADRQ